MPKAPQLPDPQFKQFSEAGKVDNSGAMLVEAVGTAAQQAFTLSQKDKLRKEVADARDKFDAMALGLGEESEVTDGIPTSVSTDPNNFSKSKKEVVLGSLAEEDVTFDAREVKALESEIAATQRGVQQGLAPTRALEINVETILRRYIDRYPGLTQEFQQVAQTALGTDSNLLAASFNAYKAAEKRAAQVKSPEETAIDAAVEAGFPSARFGLTPEERNLGLLKWRTWVSYSEAAIQAKAQAEVAHAQGAPSIADQNVNRYMQAFGRKTFAGVGEVLASAMPGVDSFSDLRSGITVMDPTAVQQTQLALRTAKAGLLSNLRLEAGDVVNIGNEEHGRYLNNLETQIGAIFDAVIESVSTQTISEETEYQLNVLENLHDFDFEQTFGPERAFYEGLYQFLPAGNRSLQDLVLKNALVATSGLHEKLSRYWGVAPLEAALVGVGGESSIDPNSNEGKAVIDAANNGAINGFENFLGDPVKYLNQQYDPVKWMRGFNMQFEDMEVGTRNKLLDMVGTPEWETFLEGSKGTPEIGQAATDLHQKVQDWGITMINASKEQLVRDVTSTSMTTRFNITKLPSHDPFWQKEGNSFSSQIPVGDVVKIVRTRDGLQVQRKTDKELANIGINMEHEPTVKGINELVRSVNNNLATNINSYARAIGNLGKGDTMDTTLDLIITDIVGAEDEE